MRGTRHRPLSEPLNGEAPRAAGHTTRSAPRTPPMHRGGHARALG